MSANERSNRGLLIVLMSKKDGAQPQMPMETTATLAVDTTVSDENTQIFTENMIPADTTEFPSTNVETPADTMNVRPIFQEVLQSIHDNHQYGDAIFEPMNPDDTDIGDAMTWYLLGEERLLGNRILFRTVPDSMGER